MDQWAEECGTDRSTALTRRGSPIGRGCGLKTRLLWVRLPRAASIRIRGSRITSQCRVPQVAVLRVVTRLRRRVPHESGGQCPPYEMKAARRAGTARRHFEQTCAVRRRETQVCEYADLWHPNGRIAEASNAAREPSSPIIYLRLNAAITSRPAAGCVAGRSLSTRPYIVPW